MYCEVRDVELHRFSDSSGKVYGACVFVRVSCEHGGSVKLWASKCRLAPVKELSIPRLELMACLLLSRLMVSVKLAVEKEVSVKIFFVGRIRRFRCGRFGRDIKNGRFGSRIR